MLWVVPVCNWSDFRHHKDFFFLSQLSSLPVGMWPVKALRVNFNTEFQLNTEIVFCAQSSVLALKLCLLKTLERPQKEMSYFFLRCSETPPPNPFTITVPLSPPLSHRYLLRWNSGQQEESEKLPHEGLVTGSLSGQGESHFLFGLGTKHHATENSRSIVMRQRNHN